MYAYLKEPVTIPGGALVGMDPPVDGSSSVTIRVEMQVRKDLVEPIYYHQRSDNPAIGR